MKIEDLKKAKDQRPFQPFLIRMADGREVRVSHPDAIAWGPELPRIALVVVPDGGWEVIDIALITSLGVQSWVTLPGSHGGP